MTVDTPQNGGVTHQHYKTNGSSNNIIDIRSDTDGFDLLKDIHDGLRPISGGEKTLPTLLLYDQEGLKLFERITYLEEYYLTRAEIEVLETFADRIAERVSQDSIVVELGSGYGFCPRPEKDKSRP